MGSIIPAVGTYLPRRILTNYDLEKIVHACGGETSDEWIVDKTGFRERLVAEENETVEEMMVAASLDAINRLRHKVAPIEHIIVATNTAEQPFPNVSGQIQNCLRIQKPDFIDPNASFADPYAGCSGVNIAMMYADSLIKSGQFRSVLVVAGEKLTSVTDYADRTTCILFGDAASAYYLTRHAGSGGFHGHSARGDGSQRDLISCPTKEKVTLYDALRAIEAGGIPKRTVGRTLVMDGPKVLVYVHKEWDNLIKNLKGNKTLNPMGLDFVDIDTISPHTYNLRGFERLEKRYPGFLKKCRLNNGFPQFICNTSTASQGKIDQDFVENAKSGEIKLNHGYGAGLVSCANLYEQPDFEQLELLVA